MILVTGASGMVGGALVQQLLEARQPVRVFTREPQKVAQFGNQVACAVGDLSQPETLGAAMAGVEAVFLVTAATQQDANAIEAAKRTGVRHIVKLSTIEAGHEPMIGHGKFHHEREELIQASGLAWTFVRPTMFMSTALEWAASIKSQGSVHYPGGTGQVGAVDAWDVAAVAAAALTRSGYAGQAYALTGPALLSMGDMVATIGQALGRPLQYRDMSDAEGSELMRQAGLPVYVITGLVEVFAAMRGGRFAYLTDAVQRVTGRAPRTFAVWCREHLAAFQ
jgi:(4-alkanoyl-5-oxo-2,5-dihydrofuran-3-yl)methyl phosphate reductase